ncbi:MAG: hypothetical protein Q7R86_02725 [bacterium]|nr:hypothetical protein [bacterium]
MRRTVSTRPLPKIRLDVTPCDPAPIAPAGQPSEDKESVLPEGTITIQLLPFLQPEEDSVVGYEVQERAVGMNANSGQQMALLLLHNQKLLPEDFSEDIYFPATTYQDASLRYGVLKLSKSSGRWGLEYVWLGIGWYGGCLIQVQ